MPTPPIIVRTPPDLRDLAEARAKQERRDLSEIVRLALRAYLTGDDGGDDRLRIATHRAEAAEAKVKRLEEELAAARQGVSVKGVAGVSRGQLDDGWQARLAAASRARAAARKARDDRFAEVLQAATAESPATVSRLADVTGFSKDWCQHLLHALGKAGYVQKTGDVTWGLPAQWVPVPGRDIREGIKAVKVLQYRGEARVTRARRRKPGTAPPALPAAPPGSVKFSGDTGAGPAVVPVPDRAGKRGSRS